ncbi:MAG: hypothetical protein JO258_13265 [Alphaproteobacteria bacterium]|nr:hypothetical protein [Alphaproteobacteria bacterium]
MIVAGAAAGYMFDTTVEVAMTLFRLGLIVAVCLGGTVGCEPGGPQRASDIQNVNGISDDISAVGMTNSEGRKTHDPNIGTTLPNNYQVHEPY